MTDLPCPHRSPDPVGRATAGCGGVKNVWRCDLKGLVMLHAEVLKTKDVKLHAPDHDGKRRVRVPARVLPCCVLCRERPESPPELAELPPGRQVADQSHSADDQDCYPEAKRAICGNCPRLDSQGQKFECAGYGQAPTCPLDLWPRPGPAPLPSGHCRGCG